MHQELRLHPGARCAAVSRIEVAAVRSSPGRLQLRYLLLGRIGTLRLPPAREPERADGLWRHTCFEAFVRAASAARYYEFNFAPSARWAAFRFDGYRSGMAEVGEIGTPRIAVRSGRGATRCTPCWSLAAYRVWQAMSRGASAFPQ